MHTQVLTEAIQKKAKCVLASKSLFDYCKIRDSETFYNEENAPYLLEICQAIEEFENDDNELLMVNMPPRHGKSRTATNSASWLLGRNPQYKIMTGTYNTILSTKFSKQVRNIIMEQPRLNKICFNNIFPKVKIKYGSASAGMWGLEGNEEDNYLATAPNSSSTGIGCDFLIIDDLIKNKYEAYHKELLNKLFEDWIRDTLYQRLEGKRKILVFMTRWSTKDPCGRLITLFQEQGRKYRLITKKAFDSKTGKMLNPMILNKRQYGLLIQTIGEDIVEANYNQTPIDLKGCLYKRFLEYDPTDIRSIDNPNGKIIFKDIRCRCDTADTGDDFLCSIAYGVTRDNQAYVLPINAIIYTQDDMETTEKQVAKQLLENNVKVFRPESNNGGRGFCRAVEKEYKKLGGTKCVFRPYTQTLNKEARILSNSTEVQNIIHYPLDWKSRYREYYISMKEYQRQGKNEHDDAQDCTTSIAEELAVNNGLRGA